MSSSAYLLVYHGSRDRRPQQAARHLAHLFAQQLTLERPSVTVPYSLNPSTALLTKPPDLLVEIASLELASLPLHQHIIEFAQQASELGYNHVRIIPLFLLSGIHVREDIPREIILAKRDIPGTLQLNLQTHLGAYRELTPLLRQQFENMPAEGRILLAHGSRYPGSHRAVEELSGQLNAIPAYWSVAPSLATQIQVLIERGCQDIAIFPYFLFAGGITEAIAQLVQQLQQYYPPTQLYLGEPLGATEDLAQVILKGIQ
jgi:sirohydrochlorin ferrochelatase